VICEATTGLTYDAMADLPRLEDDHREALANVEECLYDLPKTVFAVLKRRGFIQSHNVIYLGSRFGFSQRTYSNYIGEETTAIYNKHSKHDYLCVRHLLS